MKFDYIIQNPPYNRNLHFKFLEKGIELLSETGKMTIIEPATWLINVKNNSNKKKGNEIKDKYGKHVYKIIIENFNKEFDTSLYTPFSITYFDFSKEFSEIDFMCAGDQTTVNSIYDCNLIGNHDVIKSILNKCVSYGDLMCDHIYKDGETETDEETCFCRYDGYLCWIGTSGYTDFIKPRFFTTDEYFVHTDFGDYYNPYFSAYYRITLTTRNDISENKHMASEDTLAYQLFGKKEELENWKHFVFNNKLPVFIAMTLNIHRSNNVMDIIPWITDKQYSDEEIYSLLEFSPDEIELIEKTIKKFERHSPWFKRYMAGRSTNIAK